MISPRNHFFVAACVALVSCAPSSAPRAHEPQPDAARIARVEAGLLHPVTVRGEAAGMPLAGRMRDYRVPAVSVAVFDSSGILWARAWGVIEAGTSTPADTATLFQAASISKPVASAAALVLVEDGVLDLDEPIERKLRSWRLPSGLQTTDAPVTLRRLLSHTAGTTVSGFPGYAHDVPLPTTVQVLDGASPANTDAVVVDQVPGLGFRYSGGGYTIVQQLVSDVTDRSFAETMRRLVLEPVGMSHSTYEQPLPNERRARAARAHDGSGAPIAGGWHVYPEMAAAGLWTTPSDLARFALELTAAYRGDRRRILSPAMVREMTTAVDREAEYALGLGVEAVGDSVIWMVHGGSNEGFEAYFATLSDGRGAVVMTNGANGYALAMEIMRAIAVEYDLPGFRPTERDAVAVDVDSLHAIAGDYAATLPDGTELTVRLSVVDGQVAATVPLLRFKDAPMRASAPDRLFFLGAVAELEVERAADGRVGAVILHGFGDPLRLERV